jgi:hypothetical protein
MVQLKGLRILTIDSLIATSHGLDDARKNSDQIFHVRDRAA